MRFVYIGGKTPSARVQFEYRDDPKNPLVVAKDENGQVIEDERGDLAPDSPDKCVAFGITWRKGEPIEVKRDMFTTGEHYENAIRRLQVNRFFKALTEDAEFEDVPPKQVKRPQKAIQAPQAEPAE